MGSSLGDWKRSSSLPTLGLRPRKQDMLPLLPLPPPASAAPRGLARMGLPTQGCGWHSGVSLAWSCVLTFFLHGTKTLGEPSWIIFLLSDSYHFFECCYCVCVCLKEVGQNSQEGVCRSSKMKWRPEGQGSHCLALRGCRALHHCGTRGRTLLEDSRGLAVSAPPRALLP